MADALNNLPVARSIYHVDVASIDPKGGLRPLDMAWVEALAALMKREGQKRPIEIHRKGAGFGMTAGRHRLAAAGLLGWTTIDADIQDASALSRRSNEVSENLFKLGLSPIDRAAFVAEQIAIERALAGVAEDESVKSVIATARWKDRIGAEADDASLTMRLAFGFTEAVAEKVGLSRQTIYRDLELHRGLKPDVVEAIRGMPVAANASQLRALARMPETDQRLVAGLIVEGAAKGVTDAVATLSQKTPPDAAKKAWSTFTGTWPRIARRDQGLALAAILEHSSTAPGLKALLMPLLETYNARSVDVVLGGAGGELVEPGVAPAGAETGQRRPAEGVHPLGNRGPAGGPARGDRGQRGALSSARDTDRLPGSVTAPPFRIGGAK